MDDFPGFGAPFDLSDHGNLLDTIQVYEASRLPWSPPNDEYYFPTDYHNHGTLSGDYTLNRPSTVSSELQLIPQLGHPNIYDPNTALNYAVNGIDAVASEWSQTERSVITGLDSLDQVIEPSNVMSAKLRVTTTADTIWRSKCIISSCELRFNTWQDYETHLQAAHRDAFTCDECMYVGKSQFEVGLHARNTGHASFICKHDDCEKKFSRLDTYQRHQRTHREDATRFPCKYCKKYRGKSAFKRKDHLTQHVRSYHHIDEDKQRGHLLDRKWCPKGGCAESKPATASIWAPGVFASSKEWVKHVRTVHDEAEFSCPQPGCDRVNGKGYFRPADLRFHLRKAHGTDGSFDESIQHNLSG